MFTHTDQGCKYMFTRACENRWVLILKKACFIHIPKTGGTWVRQALRSAGVTFEDYAVNDNIHVGIRDCPVRDRFKFAFVRHPLTFYQSYWQFKMAVGWDPNNRLDVACQADSFADFIGNATGRFPGFMEKGIAELLGDEDNQVEFIGRYESLVEDLISALTESGEVFDADRIRATPPANVTDKSQFPAVYSEELKQRVVSSEKGLMRRFAYDDGPLSAFNQRT